MIKGNVDISGKVGGLEYGEVKRKFRTYLDEKFDHHLLINAQDPSLANHPAQAALGIVEVPWDPTTENFALRIYHWAKEAFLTFEKALDIKIEVWETSVNAAEVGDW